MLILSLVELQGRSEVEHNFIAAIQKSSTTLLIMYHRQFLDCAGTSKAPEEAGQGVCHEVIIDFYHE